MLLQETDLLLSWELVTGRRWMQRLRSIKTTPEALNCAAHDGYFPWRVPHSSVWWSYVVWWGTDECMNVNCVMCTNQYRLLLLYWIQIFFSMYKFNVFIKLLYKYKTEVTDSLEVITGPDQNSFIHLYFIPVFSQIYYSVPLFPFYFSFNDTFST